MTRHDDKKLGKGVIYISVGERVYAPSVCFIAGNQYHNVDDDGRRLWVLPGGKKISSVGLADVCLDRGITPRFRAEGRSWIDVTINDLRWL